MVPRSLAAQRAADRGERRAQRALTSDRPVEETMIKVLYKPTGMLVSVLGGVLAGTIFKQIWKVAFSEDDAPKATDADRSWREVLLAAAVQGAIFGLVKAAVDRGAAEGTRKVTGVWPGDEGQ
jgi:hypothetical protein